jgi:(2Fe-2S) ferredoxin
MPTINTINELETIRKNILDYRNSFKATLTLCGGTGCQASHSRDLAKALREELTIQGMGNDVLVRLTGCHGFCEQGPILVVEPGNIFYCHVSPEGAHDIITKTVCNGEILDRLLYTDPVSGKTIQKESEIPFYRSQDRYLLAQNRLIDPCSIEDYIAIGGYSALIKILTHITPEAIIREIRASGLRGRGGGGPYQKYRTR